MKKYYSIMFIVIFSFLQILAIEKLDFFHKCIHDELDVEERIGSMQIYSNHPFEAIKNDKGEDRDQKRSILTSTSFSPIRITPVYLNLSDASTIVNYYIRSSIM